MWRHIGVSGILPDVAHPMNSPQWLDRLHARAQQAPAMPREPLLLGRAECGSIDVTLAERLSAAGLPLQRGGHGWLLQGDADTSLAAIAHWLHAHDAASRWRDELMPVTDTQGALRAVIERCAVRPLGITTFAVHLVGWTSAGAVWAQQRALDKATDPGQWDTLMGGLASARETTVQTLERETWEEAGLRVGELNDVAAMGRITVRRPVPDGYMVEHIDMFEACVPDGLVPVNQDGEVQGFDCIDAPALIARLQADEFTLEASLILAHWLARRGVK
ncbi:NUDIX hydrolase [Piscinibacter sp.]|jgi:8-oxo-dGTP pyrophosphatase MutT (NUDIX family)|uniref:NUDIX hydrolase n=1 Tax=Piscinibacter sp. TaxID=1903157 RepID=UPI0035598528